MAPGTEQQAEVFATGRSSWLTLTLPGLDADFARKLDLWGAYHRIGVASLTMALTFTLVSQPGWLLWTSALYVLIAVLMPTLLSRRGVDDRRLIRTLAMFMDVCFVSLFVYRWGARSSPAAFMYIPIVSGWTLIPQRGLGRLAVLLVLLAYALLLAGEQLGGLRSSDVSLTAVPTAVDSPLLYFATLACALGAVHGLVDFTVARLREHSRVVTLLTAEKHTRDREAQLAAQLEEAQRLESLGRLAGGIAHDFNNLLTVLLGAAELAELNFTKNPSAAQRALSELQTAAARGSGLTAQLLDFASRRPAHPEDIDLNEAVQSAGKLLERLLEAQVELRVRTAEQLCVVHVDRGSLERLMINLAINARDAMPSGGVLTIAVSLVQSEEGEQALLELSDTGVGIPSKDLPHIFEPFFTTKERGKGTGLGLASVYGIVKQSGGKIAVESREGGGTTFRVHWPRSEGRSSASEVAITTQAVGSEAILLVDDDVAVRNVALAHLESAGYGVLTAGSGEQALALLRERGATVRMLVSDISMPGMSGIELARRVREKLPAIPILLISGYSEEQHGKIEGQTRFLAKPFSGQRLLAEVRQGLDREST